MSLIVGYDANWPVWFEQLRLRFDEALVGIPHTIEHVGSTAIPGMAAKPIIDLDIVVEPGRLAETIERLSASGYVHEGDLGCPGREAFDVKDKTLKAELPRHHPYVCERGNRYLNEHLAFRDFMRVHPEWVDRLNAVKWSLVRRNPNDRKAYMEGKATTYEEIMEHLRGKTPQSTDLCDFC